MQEPVLEVLRDAPSLARIAGAVLDVWPEHRKYIETRFRGNAPDFLARTEELAALALKSMGENLTRYCEDYRWMCANYMEEQIHFQRYGEYRLSSFDAVNREIYGNPAYMERYVHGLLLSEVLWINHATAIDLFRTQFLTANKQRADYLEVGPGHGLFFYFAANDVCNATVTGWDISDTSIAETRQAMRIMGVNDGRYDLVQQDLFAAECEAESFDAVVISEVLEHLEQPGDALKALHRVMRTGARIFINAPVNAPAPDHIYLWRTTDALTQLVTDCGFTIEQAHYLPIAGKTLEYCRKYNVDISCVFIARKD